MTIDLSMQGTQSDLAWLVGVTQPAISQMMAAGKIPAVGTLGELLRAYVQHLQRQADSRIGEGQLDLVQERAGLAQAQREGYEIKNAALRRDYAPVPVLAHVLGIASEAVAVRFDELEHALSSQLPELSEPAAGVVQQVIASARAEWLRATQKLECSPVEVDADNDSSLEDVQ